MPAKFKLALLPLFIALAARAEEVRLKDRTHGVQLEDRTE